MAVACAIISACATPSVDENPRVQTKTQPLASADDYVRVCGICHLEDGSGVPGAFPPLDARLAAVAGSEAGRNYLVGILKNGLYGKISVDGTSYNGAMPPLASQLSEQQMAGLLNYALSNFAPLTPQNTDLLFSETEITARTKTVDRVSGAQLRLQVEVLNPALTP